MRQKPKSIPIQMCSRCLTEALATQLLGILRTADLLHEALEEQSVDSSTVDNIGNACESLHTAYELLCVEAGLVPDEDGDENSQLN